MRRPILVAGAVAFLVVLDPKAARSQAPASSERWTARDLPLQQAALAPGLERAPLTLRDTARGDRWIGVGVRGARFAPDGRYVYFRWNSKPRPDEDPEADPWFRATRDGGTVERVAEDEVHAVPAAERSWQLGEFHGGASEPISWSLAGDAAAWASGGRAYAWDATRNTRLLFAGDETVRTVRLRPAGDVVHVLAGEELAGETRALTSGAWEVRAVTLSRDRRRFLIGAGREHPCDDHLYTLPATGGELVRLTQGEGRFQGALSPDGFRLLVVRSLSTALPDLFLTDAAPGAKQTRITQSGSDEISRHPLLRPEVVSFRHPDGKLVWGALYKPQRPHPLRAAVLHIHGGGYRQFSHRGYSVYGWAIHLGLLHWLVEQGVTVLDFDYRGSSGFGRDYRTDIYRSMGEKDVEGAVAAVDFLAREHGVDRTRVGLYGISYGGFFTLAALFRHPGVFAAGVANAAVTDWAHYEHDWTSHILGLPTTDPEAYRRSSPIEQVDGLRDPLLIVHGLVDDNVQFQDAARLVQKLIEREKDFEVAIYPVEPHTMATEASRYDYARRVAAFFERHLLAPR